MSARPSAAEIRNQQLKIIHTLARKCGLVDETGDELYRALVEQISKGRTRSSAALTSPERETLIKRLRSTAPPAPKRTDAENRPSNVDCVTELQKIEALLSSAGRPWSYAATVLRTMTRGRKTRLQFASSGELAAIITALEKDALRRLNGELTERLAKAGIAEGDAVAIARASGWLGPAAELRKNSEALHHVCCWLQSADA